VALAGYLGLRPKEIRLAAWEAVGAVGDGTFTVGRARTKSGAARTRVLTGPIAAHTELKAWRLASGRPASSEPIIGLTASTLNQWTWKTLKPIVADVLGRDDVTLYTLRHTHASALHYAGYTVPSAARRMGHGPQLHVRTYAHVIDSLEGQARYPDLDALIAAARDLEFRVGSRDVAFPR
jgi:integrase